MPGPYLVGVLFCAAAMAQLPPPQAPPPPPEPPAASRKAPAPILLEQTRLVDATVTDAAGRPVPGLTMSAFQVEADGKPRNVVGCRFVPGAPARWALVVDDLSLSTEHLAAVRTALGQFAGQLPPGNEAAVLPTSSGQSALDAFTGSAPALAAEVARLGSAPRPPGGSPKVFTTGTLGELQAILDGLRFLPGRKIVALFSERLRVPARAAPPAWTGSLLAAANAASAAVYVFDPDRPADPPTTLEQGAALLARETGGLFLDAAAGPYPALSRLLQDAAGYYVLSFATDPLQRLTPLAVKLVGKDLQVQARRAPMGRSDTEDAAYPEAGAELYTALTTAAAPGPIAFRMTPLLGLDEKLDLALFLHLDARDLTLTKGLDGAYTGALQAGVAFFQDGPKPANMGSHSVAIRTDEAGYRAILASGYDCALRLPAPPPGYYQLRVAVLNDAAGKVGSSSRFLALPDFKSQFALSSIVLEEGADTQAQQPTVQVVFQPGRQIAYSYNIFNLRHNAENRAAAEAVSRIFFRGATIFTSNPASLDLESRPGAWRWSARGVVKLGPHSTPGVYVLEISITDKLAPPDAPHTVVQSVAFEVRP